MRFLPLPQRVQRSPHAWTGLEGGCSRLLLVLLMLLPLASVGAGAGTRAVLVLELNHSLRDEVFPVLREDDVLLPVEDLQRAQVDVKALGGSRETLEGKAYVSLRSLSPSVTYEVDEERAQLNLTLPPELLPLTRVDLRSSLRPARFQLNQGASAFMNYGASLRGRQLTLSTETAAGIGELLVSTTAFWRPGSRPVRGLSRLTVDKPGQMLRTVVGDDQVGSGLLGGGAVIGGLHLSRNFELDPYFLQTPSAHFSGSVATPSTVDVFVNGNRIRHAELPPGPFELANLPLTRGQVGTRYVLRDAFGRERLVESLEYVSAGLLAPGVSAFNLSLGLRRRELATESFHYGGPAFLGRYRRGLSPRLTGGLRLELARGLASGGATASFGLPIGELELAVAGSIEENRPGVAGSVSYGYVTGRLGLQAFLRGMSRSYATLSLASAYDRPLLNASTHVSVSLNQSFRLGGEFSTAVYRDVGAQSRAALIGTLRLSDTSTLTLSGGALHRKVSGTEFTSLLTVHFMLGAHTTGSVSGRKDAASPSAGVEVSSTIPNETGFGYRVRAEAAAHPWGEAMASYQGTMGRYSAGLEWIQGALTPTAELAGSVVAVGGQLMLARPIDQGFALVRVPGLSGARVFLNNREVAQTDQQGNALIPNLLPYHGNRLSISDQDVPEDFGVPNLEMLVAPYSRRGAAVVFPTRRIRPIRGIVALHGTDASVLAYGDLTLEVGSEVLRSPIGSKGEFELEGVPTGTHEARITYAGGVCRARLEIPATEGKLIELDVVPCVSQSGDD
ncbi:fimbria/pilus outer membrane usher protein [Hyalangium gracile]|uniref:fimbria/pilus outer membrane usher protein n=1 Tax=Hyalangium gracile TaxID=394092 RepID=UPI001CCBC27E|nr:fimbria/pilus outer membrane usher protein [Hyalangium gracile]